MSRHSKSLPTAAGLALVLLLPACGGTVDPQPADASASASASASVRLEGCVVDQFYVPHEGVPVRVVSADGRLLANATSGRMGEFIVRLPAGGAAALTVDRADGDWVKTPLLDRDRVVDSCLVARD